MSRGKTESTVQMKLSVSILEGLLTRSTKIFGTMDPFIEVEYSGHVHKSRVAKGGGRTPKWRDVFEIPINTLEDKIIIRCFAEELMSD